MPSRKASESSSKDTANGNLKAKTVKTIVVRKLRGRLQELLNTPIEILSEVCSCL